MRPYIHTYIDIYIRMGTCRFNSPLTMHREARAILKWLQALGLSKTLQSLESLRSRPAREHAYSQRLQYPLMTIP